MMNRQTAIALLIAIAVVAMPTACQSVRAAEPACPVLSYGDLATALDGIADRMLAGQPGSAPIVHDDADFLIIVATCLRTAEAAHRAAINRLLAPVGGVDTNFQK